MRLSLVCLVACAKLEVVSVTASDSADACFTDISVFDGEQMLAHQDVAVIGGVIAFEKKDGCIDGKGKTLLPGLIDMHMHFMSFGQPPWKRMLPNPEKVMGMMLHAGVTTGLVAQHQRAEYKLDRDGLVGPRLFMAGTGLSKTNGHPIPLIDAMVPAPLAWLIRRGVNQVDDAESARALVAKEAEHQPTFYKIFYDSLPESAPHMDESTLSAACAEAKKLGMRPVVHVGTATDMEQAAKAGAELLMHTPYRDLLTPAQVQAVRDSGAGVITTLNVWRAGAEKRAGKSDPFEHQMVEGKLFDWYRDEPTDADWRDGWVRQFGQHGAGYAEVAGKNLLALRAAGVAIYPGTDTGPAGLIPGAAMHMELQALQRLGFSPIELLKSIALAAERLDPHAKFGRVKPGYRADLLLVNGDPTTDIAVLTQIHRVYRDGHMVIRSRL